MGDLREMKIQVARQWRHCSGVDMTWFSECEKMPEGIPYYLRNAGLRHHSKPKYVKYNMIARIKQNSVGVTGGVDAQST